MASLTAQYRTALTSSSLDELLTDHRKTMRDLDAELGRLRFGLAEALEDLHDMRAERLPAQQAVEGAAQPVHVRSCTGTLHVVATRAFDHTPLFHWRAMCGWRFGLASHTRDASATEDRCAQCLRHMLSR